MVRGLFYFQVFTLCAFGAPCSVVIDDIVARGDCKGVLKHGKFIGYYDNGMPAWEVRFKYDVLDGAFRRFYPNGGLHFEGSYKNGLLEGKFIQYSFQDRLLRGRFKKGVLHGWLDIFEDGSKRESMKFYYGKLYKRLFF